MIVERETKSKIPAILNKDTYFGSMLQDFQQSTIRTSCQSSKLSCYKNKEGKLANAVRLNKVSVIPNFLEDFNDTLLMIVGSKSNAVYSVQCLFDNGYTKVNETDEQTLIHYFRFETQLSTLY